MSGKQKDTYLEVRHLSLSDIRENYDEERSDRLIFDPVRFVDGSAFLSVGAYTLPILVAGEPVPSFLPGWRASHLYTGFAPLFLLELIHESGARATWFLDHRIQHLGDHVLKLPREMKEFLKATATPVLRRVLEEVLFQDAPRLDKDIQAFMQVYRETRDSIAMLCMNDVINPPMNWGVETLAPNSLLFPDRDRRLTSISREWLRKCLDIDWQDKIIEALTSGSLTWPSPIDGHSMQVQGAIAFDDFHFAYRFVDARTGLVIFVIVAEHYSHVGGMWFPSIGVMISKGDGVGTLGSRLCPHMPWFIVKHVAKWADQLIPYLRRGGRRIASVMRGRPGVHIGHQLWNELSGIDFMVEKHPKLHTEYIVLAAESDIEIYGPIDKIFPEILGHVNRNLSDVEAMIAMAYDNDTIVVRITRRYVSESLRRRVLSNKVHDIPGRAAEKVKSGAHVIVIGLRVENRTIVNLEVFLQKVIKSIFEFDSNVIIVFDGHNARGETAGEALIESHGEYLANVRPVLVEKQIVENLRSAMHEHADRIFDTIGLPISESLSWIAVSECFIALWGAGLAKYRWIGNKPGFVITNHDNLLHRPDLHIYDSEEFMETPAAIEFIDAAYVTDDPNAEQIVPVGPGQPSYFNFHVNEHLVFQQIHNFLRRTLNPRKEN